MSEGGKEGGLGVEGGRETEERQEWEMKNCKNENFHPQGGVFRASWPPEGSKTSIFIIFFKLRI